VFHRPDSVHLDLAVAILRSGGIIGHATEGVWGLACDPFQPATVERLLALKSRPVHKGLILLAADLAQVQALLQPLSEDAARRIEAPGPHPLTWLLPVRREVPRLLRGAHDTLAVRITHHPQARALLERYAGPLVSTSANPAGRRPAQSALRVRQYFREALDLVLPGEVGEAGGPSEIRRLADDQAIRGRG